MPNRSQDLLVLRPKIAVKPTSNDTLEHFQNTTLRPLLKFQNELFIQVFRQYIVKRKGIFNNLIAEAQLNYIKDALRKDIKFKQLLLGMVMGLFTLEEWAVFEQHEKEFIRRITDMLIQRLQSQLEKLQE